MIKLEVSGFPQVVTRLNRIRDTVTKRVRETMREQGEFLVKEAKLNTPVDEFRLEESIKMTMTRDSARYTQIVVTMGGVIDGVNVDQYAAIIHENYEEIINPEGIYVWYPKDESKRPRVAYLREGTKAKQAANPGRYVGGKFLERAAETVRKQIDGRFYDVITDVIEENE